MRLLDSNKRSPKIILITPNNLTFPFNFQIENDDASLLLSYKKPTRKQALSRKRPMNHQPHAISYTNNNNSQSTHRIDNTHTTFVNCLRNWDDPFLQGVKPIKQIPCSRCDGCGCRLNSSANSDNHNHSHHNHHHHNHFSTSCSSTSEHNNLNSSIDGTQR